MTHCMILDCLKGPMAVTVPKILDCHKIHNGWILDSLPNSWLGLFTISMTVCMIHDFRHEPWLSSASSINVCRIHGCLQDMYMTVCRIHDYLEDPWPGLSRGSITVWSFHICRLNQCSGLSTESMTVYRTHGYLQDPWLKAGSITVSRTHGWDFPQDPCVSVRSVIVYDCLPDARCGTKPGYITVQ